MKVILLSFLLIFLNGCSIAVSTGVTMAAGNTYLSKERAQIRITEDEKDTKECQYIKHVRASSAWGGLLFQDKALEKTISDLTHESVKAGANLLLVRSKHKGFNGSNSEGDAYRCPCLDSKNSINEEKE